MFVDRVEIEIIAGKGGDGCMAFDLLTMISMTTMMIMIVRIGL